MTRCSAFAIVPLAAATVVAVQRPSTPDRDVARLYAEMCANCHGPRLQGAQGPSLIDDEWKHGADDASIAKSISVGQPATGMPPFGAALSPQEVRAFVIYIREEATKATCIAGAAPRKNFSGFRPCASSRPP